jgi:hypothetical protein
MRPAAQDLGTQEGRTVAGHMVRDTTQFNTAWTTARSISVICLGHGFDQQIARSSFSTYLRNIMPCSASTSPCLDNDTADIADATSHRHYEKRRTYEYYWHSCALMCQSMSEVPLTMSHYRVRSGG